MRRCCGGTGWFEAYKNGEDPDITYAFRCSMCSAGTEQVKEGKGKSKAIFWGPPYTDTYTPYDVNKVIDRRRAWRAQKNEKGPGERHPKVHFVLVRSE